MTARYQIRPVDDTHGLKGVIEFKRIVSAREAIREAFADWDWTANKVSVFQAKKSVIVKATDPDGRNHTVTFKFVEEDTETYDPTDKEISEMVRRSDGLLDVTVGEVLSSEDHPEKDNEQ